ncbi:ComF family protein [Inmirania thermothiophila]|uniref:ComF family protein n=1 Tax=Inmirania thermothiophila TaxID=1750597 RepID=A0A3N1Y7K7_9GAMM|nr:ComF family protein [Inmirania thermothiophila]ROR34501.1 ComF family protein [Inmirania thermothiophila]
MVDGIARRILRLLYPWRCLLCGGPGDGRDLCRDCADALPRHPRPCPLCAAPLPEGAAGPCGRCLRRPPPFRAWAALAHAPPADRIVHRAKYRGDLAALALLAALMAEAAPAVDGVLVPVPLHRRRLAQRGYNQALELARGIARARGLPLAPALLARRRDTPSQVGLDARARRRNLRTAFVARDAAPRRVILVDDVLTSGATAEAAARALRRAGAAEIHLWVAARAAPPA